jgi:tRNA-Thr(GGU) m(6)t(6)A37 methyltransferase TsaA
MKIIAHIETDLPEKFGIPRQSGLAEHLRGTIVFEPEYRRMEALKGLEDFNYIWLLWQFEGTERQEWSPTVRPPRLGGNTRLGVFATRSPFRPNNIGLSSVKLDGIRKTERGPVLDVSGIDLRNGTPIYDIKPYLRYADSHPDASDGFAQAGQQHRLEVVFPEELLQQFPKEKQESVLEILTLDPRPAYHNDPNRRYGVAFAGYDIHFSVEDQVLTVHAISPVQS